MKEEDPKTLDEVAKNKRQDQHQPEAEKKEAELSDQELEEVAGGGGGAGGTMGG